MQSERALRVLCDIAHSKADPACLAMFYTSKLLQQSRSQRFQRFFLRRRDRKADADVGNSASAIPNTAPLDSISVCCAAPGARMAEPTRRHAVEFVLPARMQSSSGLAAVRITCDYVRFPVESSVDRISFGISALGIPLFQRVSVPMTATLVKLFEPGGRPFLPYLFFL